MYSRVKKYFKKQPQSHTANITRFTSSFFFIFLIKQLPKFSYKLSYFENKKNNNTV